MNKFIPFLLMLLFVVSINSFAGGEGEGGKRDDGQIVIGFTYHGSGDFFQTVLKNEFEKYADSMGVKVTVIDPLYSIEKQVAAIETFISLGVDAIVVSPLDFTGLAPAVVTAKEAGVPLISLNARVDGDVYYAGSLNYDSGILEGEYMAEVLPQGAKIVYLRGTEGMDHTNARRKGIQDALLDKRPDVELLAEQTANYARVEALDVMEDWIQAFPQIDGVIAANDQMALGALEALKAAGKTGVLIAGIDGTDEAKQNVKNGTFAVTILQDAPGQARASLDVALKLINGETVPKDTIIPFVTIGKENIDDFM